MSVSTLATSAQRYAEKILAKYSQPIYNARVSIPSEAFDIEEVQIGQVVGFSNADNYIDDLQLQIVSYDYSPRLLTLDLGELLDRQQDIVTDISDDLQAEQYEQLPTAPS